MHPSANYVISGDINEDVLCDLISIDNFDQHVLYPTRGDKILDITISDLPSKDCVIILPLSPELAEDRLPSDHHIPITTHFTNTTEIYSQVIKECNKVRQFFANWTRIY